MILVVVDVFILMSPVCLPLKADDLLVCGARLVVSWQCRREGWETDQWFSCCCSWDHLRACHRAPCHEVPWYWITASYPWRTRSWGNIQTDHTPNRLLEYHVVLQILIYLQAMVLSILINFHEKIFQSLPQLLYCLTPTTWKSLQLSNWIVQFPLSYFSYKLLNISETQGLKSLNFVWC